MLYKINNSNYELHDNRPVITDRTIHNDTPDIVMLDKTIKGA
jgi:hypothetical protein